MLFIWLITKNIVFQPQILGILIIIKYYWPRRNSFAKTKIMIRGSKRSLTSLATSGHKTRNFHKLTLEGIQTSTHYQESTDHMDRIKETTVIKKNYCRLQMPNFLIFIIKKNLPVGRIAPRTPACAAAKAAAASLSGSSSPSSVCFLLRSP